jgi:hypothetical protein
MRRLLLALLLLGTPLWAQSREFVIDEGGQTNLFLDHPQAQVHLLLRDGRLVFAFPSENSGLGLWFDGKLTVEPGSLVPLEEDDPAGQAVQVTLRVHQPTPLRKVVLDSIRTLRDESEGVATAEEIARAREQIGPDAQTSCQLTPLAGQDNLSSALFRRQQRYLGEPPAAFELSIDRTSTDQAGNLVLPEGLVKMVARAPFPPMQGFTPSELYRDDYLRQLRREPGRRENSLRALEFLVRREKMMAGSWRFLTYFGRDTLISLAMLEPILSEQALLAGVQSVLVRLSPEGMVAHEEDIGPWAEWRHLQAGQPEQGMTPVYDHKMVDDDLLLPVLLAKLVENGRSSVLEALLDDPASREAILRNASYVLELLGRQRLVSLNPGEATGDWRDSHEGLGGGVYPASVNADLALPALDALAMLYGRAGEHEQQVATVRQLRPVWEALTAGYWIELSPEQVAERLQRFAQTLSPRRRAGFEQLMAARPDLLRAPFRFPVLSFKQDRTPVVVPHTDVAFSLFYGHPDESHLQAILDLLERPFPYGLATPGGHVVASPVFSEEPEHYQSLGFGQYHGLVVWSWPSAMLQFGLLRQKARFPAQAARMDALLEQIRQSEQRVGALATSELWAIDLDESGVTWRAYGVAGDQAESNALQLWSTVYPALEFVRDRP